MLSAGTAPAESAYYLSLRACLRARIALSRRPDPAALLVLREQRDLGREHRWVEVHQLALESLAGWDCEDDSQQASEELSDLAARCAMPKVAHTANVVATSVTGKCEPAGQTLARAQADGLRFVEAKARYALGCAGEDPAGNFGQAITLFESMGAATWVKAVLSGARERGVSLPRPKVNHASNALTATEWQMVRFVRDGLSNPEISQVMHYSRKTVEAYLSRLYRKTGCQSRVELVVALERGELGLDDPR